MKQLGYILFAALLVFASCVQINEPEAPVVPAPEGERVQITFNVAVPNDGPATKAMGMTPTIDPDGFYIAVFGGSGYFNEWVKATVVSATANYDGTNNTVYSINAMLSISDSRLRLHFIANCPVAVRTSPPIAGSQDTEEYVMSHIRSQHSESYNDGYWQKVILPNGVRVEKSGNTYVATQATMEQFPNPIVLVRNFARVYLRNLTPDVGTQGVNVHQLVTIKKFGLAYAPSEGVIAPILQNPYSSNAQGGYIYVPDNDETTRVYFESFFINYQNYTLDQVSAAPFGYDGYSPADQAYNYYTGAGHTDPGAPLEADLKTWDSEHPENNVLYVYERTMPSAAVRATRLIILAERVDQNNVSDGDRFYALDIVNNEGVAIPLLRNQSYTVHLLNIESGSGESDITMASTASSATVSGDPNFQNLINISDGKSSIGTSFTEKFYVQPEEDYVMFRYIPTNVTDDHYTANQEGNELVSIKVGSVNTQTGVFTELTPTEASSQGILTFKTEGNNYKVWISKDNSNNVIQYVRAQNDWVAATQAQIENSSIEKWGMVRYQLNESYKDSNNYFTEERTMAIHVEGSYNDRPMSRNVIIKTSPRQSMQVSCKQKFVMAQAGEPEVIKILIPRGLSRSVFPLEFTIEPDGYSLTPDGDVLPVTYGTSTIDGHDEPAYYFVKTVTQEQYDALGTENGWKVIECHFKTTVAQNACTVYVKNHYFTDDAASDEFFNFAQRLFTFTTQPTGTVYRHGNTSYVFVLDNAHSSNNRVWWDPNNELSWSSDYRVLPPMFTVVLNGYTAQYDGDTPVNPLLEHVSGNTYIYHLGDGTGTPSSTVPTVTLALTATGAVGSNASITLSTANITENPGLYADATSNSVTIQGATFSNLRFGSSDTYTLPLGLNQNVTFRFSYTSGMVVPITVRLDGLTLNGNGDNNLLMTSNGDGTYTFTPTNTNTTTYYLALKSTTRFSPCTVTLSHEDYETATKTANRTASFQIPANALYFRNSAGTGNASDFQQNSTYVYMYNTSTYSTSSYLARSRSGNNNYYNASAMTVTLSNFTIVNDDATVYFAYRRGNNYNIYYATSTLSQLLDATTSNRVSLRFSTTKP